MVFLIHLSKLSMNFSRGNILLCDQKKRAKNMGKKTSICTSHCYLKDAKY